MFYSTIMKIDSIDRLRDIRDALLVEQGINPTRQGEQAIKVVVERIDEIQATLDKSSTKNKNSSFFAPKKNFDREYNTT